MAFEHAAALRELDGGGPVPVTVGGRAIVLCRVGDEVFAVQRACIHQGGDLAEGIVASDGFVVCPVHGWRFDARTGRHELSPETCLRSYPVRVEGERVLVDPTPRPMFSEVLE